MRNFILSLFLICYLPIAAQRLEVNTKDAEKQTQLIITANKKGSEYTVDDSVVKRGVVFFSAGYQSSIVSNLKTDVYFIELDIVHNDNRLGCLQEFKSKALLELEDGTVIECFQISEPDCGSKTFKGTFALMPYGASHTLMAQNFEKLKITNIEKITVVTTTNEMEFKVKPKLQDFLKHHFTLVANSIDTTSKTK